MYLGIDIGGTHTDAVLLDSDFSVLSSAKVHTDKSNILSGLRQAMLNVMLPGGKKDIKRFAVCGTLGLNSLLTGQADPVGILACGGPGLSPDFFFQNSSYRLLSGEQNHLGEIINPIKKDETEKAVQSLIDNGAKAFAVGAKFSPKNNTLEEHMAQAVKSLAPDMPLSISSHMSGKLNFPRRLQTAVYNSAVCRLFKNFCNDLDDIKSDINCQLYAITASGAALPLEEAAVRPVNLIGAGPAASLLGAWSLLPTGNYDDILLIDIGGTSTDISLMAAGIPLMCDEGLTIAGRKTLVRGLMSRSVAVGGDSSVVYSDGQISVGPERLGPAIGLKASDLGKRPPTLSDCFNVLELAKLGDIESSRRSLSAWKPSPQEIASLAMGKAVRQIKKAAFDLVEEINQRPLYTINEILLNRPINPSRAIIIGGPAEAMQGYLKDVLEMDCDLLPHSSYVGAIGAALARPAMEADLYADTGAGIMSIPSLGRLKQISSSYSAAHAESDLLAALREASLNMESALPPRISYSAVFKTLDGRGRSGKIMRLSAQCAPGVLK